jgi:hypothetical protein
VSVVTIPSTLSTLGRGSGLSTDIIIIIIIIIIIMFLGSKVRLVRRTDNLTAIYEPIV